MATPDDLRYTNQHEWVRVDGDTVTVGITDFAASALGDIVFVQLPSVGDAIEAGDTCGEIESTKSISELFAPVGGTVTEVNSTLENTPETVGASPYGDGWLFRLDAPGTSIDGLLDAGGYRELIGEA